MKVRDLVTVSSDAIDEMFAFEAHRGDKGVRAVIVLKKLDIRLEFAADMFVAFAARVDELHKKIIAPAPRVGKH